MQTVIAWVYSNVTWVFSGIGVTAIFAFLERKTIAHGVQAAFHNRDMDKALTGKWTGYVVEDKTIQENDFTYDVTWDIKSKGGRISVDSTSVHNKSGNKHVNHYSLSGHVLYSNYIRLDYIHSKEERINFGAELLELKPSGRKLVGKFVGYSSEGKGIISGTIEANKSP